jgi:hypothetical protein
LFNQALASFFDSVEAGFWTEKTEYAEASALLSGLQES